MHQENKPTNTAESPGEIARLEMLSVFDNASIGNEFAKQDVPASKKSDEIDKRRDAAGYGYWINGAVETRGQILHQTQVQPEMKFEKVRRFETTTMHLRGLIFWAAFVLIAAGGIIFSAWTKWFH